MKIQCISALVCLSCLTSVASSSLQVRGFMSQRALANPPDGDDPAAAGDKKPKEDNTKKNVNKETSAWSGVSNVNFEVTVLIAGVWVFVLGSAPILIYYVGGKRVTNSAIVLSCLMWLALFGGLFLFTNVILFNSPHFQQVRSLTIIECTYFMTQVITTVGYGDITPAMPRGQLFVGAYVTLSFFVIALLMSEMQSVVMDKVKKYKEEIKHRYYTTHSATANDTLTTTSQSHSQSTTSCKTLGFKPEKPSTDALFLSVAIFAGVATVWVLFFHFYPGEDKSWREAIYMCLITLTTVGLGAITPVTEGGMLFGAFFMFFGTSALVNVVGNFSTYILELDLYESWCPKEFGNDLTKFREKYNTGGGHNISEEAFLILTLLQRKLVSEDQIDQIQESYKTMAGRKGSLNLKGIASNVSSEIDHEGLGDSETEAGTSARQELSAR